MAAALKMIPGIVFVALVGSTDLKPTQADLDDLRSQISGLERRSHRRPSRVAGGQEPRRRCSGGITLQWRSSVDDVLVQSPRP